MTRPRAAPRPWRRPSRAWSKAAPEPPLLISRAEWARASDVFPIEITDMRAGYQVLRGSDPLAAATVSRADLRQALERELRGKLLRLRQGYAAAAGDEKALGHLAGGQRRHHSRPAARAAHAGGTAGAGGALPRSAGRGGGARRRDAGRVGDAGRSPRGPRLAMFTQGVRGVPGRRDARGGVCGPTSARRPVMKRSSAVACATCRARGARPRDAATTRFRRWTNG